MVVGREVLAVLEERGKATPFFPLKFRTSPTQAPVERLTQRNAEGHRGGLR